MLEECYSSICAKWTYTVEAMPQKKPKLLVGSLQLIFSPGPITMPCLTLCLHVEVAFFV